MCSKGFTYISPVILTAILPTWSELFSPYGCEQSWAWKIVCKGQLVGFWQRQLLKREFFYSQHTLLQPNSMQPSVEVNKYHLFNWTYSQVSVEGIMELQYNLMHSYFKLISTGFNGAFSQVSLKFAALYTVLSQISWKRGVSGRWCRKNKTKCGFMVPWHQHTTVLLQ